MNSQSKMSSKSEKAKEDYRAMYGFKVLWDFENLWLESTYSCASLYYKIQEALQTLNPKYYILGNIIACGVEKNANRSQIHALKATGKYDFMLDVDVTGNCSVCGKPLQANRRPTPPFARNTDLADGRLVKHMLLHAIHELPKKSNILMITADSDFINTISGLVRAKCNVMVCIDHQSTHRLCNSGKSAWFWDRLILGRECMTKRATFGITWREYDQQGNILYYAT